MCLLIRVVLLVDCVMKVFCDTLEESLSDLPTRLHEFPLFFSAFLRVGSSGICDVGAICVRFDFLKKHTCQCWLDGSIRRDLRSWQESQTLCR
jgi:hypothetical protein